MQNVFIKNSDDRKETTLTNSANVQQESTELLEFKIIFRNWIIA